MTGNTDLHYHPTSWNSRRRVRLHFSLYKHDKHDKVKAGKTLEQVVCLTMLTVSVIINFFIKPIRAGTVFRHSDVYKTRQKLTFKDVRF